MMAIFRALSPSTLYDGSPCSVGLMVPASTFMYGSILMAVTFSPVIFNRRPVDEAIYARVQTQCCEDMLMGTNQ